MIPDHRLSPIPQVNNSTNTKHVEIIEIEESSKKSGENIESHGPNYKIETNRNFLDSDQ